MGDTTCEHHQTHGAVDTPPTLITGADPSRLLDALLVKAPLRDYAQRPRVNNFTLPVLGMGYLATYAATLGFHTGVLDAEAHGLGIEQTIRIIDDAAPRWVGFNLLAPTYEISTRIAARLDPEITITLGGHQAKTMPTEILIDPRMSRCAALVLGEGETRVAELLVGPSSSVRWDEAADVTRLRPRGCVADPTGWAQALASGWMSSRADARRSRSLSRS